MRPRYLLFALTVGIFSASALLALDAGAANAQIFLTSGSSPYTQDFNSLTPGGTSTSPYADNSTILGLYALIGKGPLGTGAATSTPTIYNVGDGSLVNAGIEDFGSGTSTNRAFGTFVNDATTTSSGFIAYGFRFVNNDAVKTITQFTVQYTGEQWRRNSTTDQTIAFSSGVFAAGAGGLDPLTGYSANTSLDYVSPGGAPAGGSIPLNSQTKTATITATVRPGQEFWIRWVDVNDVGNDHATAIDNLSVNASFDPTPAPPAFVSGLIGSVVGCAQFGIVRLRGRQTRRLRQK